MNRGWPNTRGGRGTRGVSRGRGGGPAGNDDSGSRGGKLGDDEYTPGSHVEGSFGKETSLDMSVMRKEDSAIESNKQLSLNFLSLDGFNLPLRPGYGEKGQKILLKTNYFRMQFDVSKEVFRYHVEVTSDRKKRKSGDRKHAEETEPPGRRSTRRAFDLLFSNSELKSLGVGIATDYSKTMITAKRLDLGISGTREFRIQYHEAEETTPRRNPITYTFIVSFVGLVPVTDLLKSLDSGDTVTNSGELAGKDDAVQALNIIMARTPNSQPNIYQAGQNKFFEYPNDNGQYLDLTGGLIAVRGYYCSVRTSVARVLVNLNAQCSPFYPAINMWELMDRHSRFQESQWQYLEKFIEKLRVKTDYLKTKEGSVDVRIKTVIGISHRFVERRDPKTGTMETIGNARGDHGNARQIKFQCDEFPQDGSISVEDYFRKKHNQTINKPSAWLLNCGTSQNPVWIPPELCQVMPGQPYRGKLSEIQTTNMLTVAARPPAENARRIIGAGQQVIGIRHHNEGLAAFGVEVGKDMVLVAGRRLESPPVLYKNKASVPTAGASWNMIRKNFAVPGELSCWAVLTLGNATISPNQLAEFKKAVSACGMTEKQQIKPSASSRVEYHADLPGLEQQNDNSIKEAFHRMRTDGVKIVLVVLPSSNAANYARVKFWGDVKTGIHSVCAQGIKLDKGAQYFANITLKLNLKCGGINQLLPEQKLGFLAQRGTMIVGLDVTHPAPKTMEGTPSIAGIVASIDEKYGKWPGNVRCQKSRQEMIEDLDILVRERLELWKETNGRLPDRVLIYRDGVSEGQYKAVLTTELDKIRAAFETFYPPGSHPKLTIMVVGKRHHTRFYPVQEKDADMSRMGRGNPKNGTIVDRGITMQKGWDFYLQAHTCLQGTAKPAHYVIILDEMKLGVDEIQGITHHLCYLYGRATKAVSVCPPAYYADIICERARCYLAKYINHPWPPGKAFDENEAPWYQGGIAFNLKNSMFYV